MNAKRRAKLKQLAKTVDLLKTEFQALFREEEAARVKRGQLVRGSVADKLEDCVGDLEDLQYSIRFAQFTDQQSKPNGDQHP
jgi:5'-deoxynucleotidase YfbR-like HD superfamily hydrolase